MKKHKSSRAPKLSKSIQWVGLTSAALLVATGCGSDASGGQDNGSEIRSHNVQVWTLNGSNHYETVALEEYTDSITEASDGLIEFEYFYSATAGPAEELPQSMQDGVVDLAISYPAYTPTEMPMSNWAADLGFLPSGVQPAGTLAGAAAHLEWSMTDEDLQQEYTDNGMKLLGATQLLPQYDLMCNSPINSAEDASGLRTRVGGETWAEDISVFDMEPVHLAGEEIYEGFQRGVIDCIAQTGPNFVNDGSIELADYHYEVDITGWNLFALTASDNFWNDLNQAEQQLFWDQMPVFIESQYDVVFDLQSDYVQAIEEENIESSPFPPELVEAMEERRAGQLEDLPGEAPDTVTDPNGAIDRRVELNDEWEEIVADLGYESAESWQAWSEEYPEGDVDLSAWVEALEENVLKDLRP